MIKKMLVKDEGVKNVLYWDHLGYPTIGIGHLILKEVTKDPVKIGAALSQQLGRNVHASVLLSDADVTYLFNKDLDAVKRGIGASSLGAVYAKLDPVRQAALENMCFQMGVTGVCKFKKMIAALEAKDWKEAKRQGLDSGWAKQTPNRAARVTGVLETGNVDAYWY